MKFSLLHPSRDRVEMAGKAITEWTSRFSGENTYEYILSLDADDPALEDYRTLAEDHSVCVTVNRNRSLVDAVNEAAALSSGNVLIAISDDFGCPVHWDLTLEDIVGEDLDVAVLVHDGVSARIMTLPIVGRTFYERHGYIYYPGYPSFLADDDLTALADREGKLVDARHIVFEHRHFTTGRSPLDNTYRRRDTALEWLRGDRMFRRRCAADFGTRRVSLGLLLAWTRIDCSFVIRLFLTYLRALGAVVKRASKWRSG